MKRISFFLPAIYMAFALLPQKAAAQSQSCAPHSSIYLKKQSSASLLFTENRGQVADERGTLRPDVLFTAHSGGAKIFLTAAAIHYQFSKTDYPAGYEQDEKRVRDREKQDRLRTQITTRTHRFTVSLAGANPAPRVRREEKTGFTENFYLGHCPDGITGVNTYRRIVYEGVYPGIDWVIYSNGQGMKYDFIVHPGADYKQIRLKVTDADGVRITEDGALLMKTSLGEVREEAPVSFSGNKSVETRFQLSSDKEVGFEVAGYDRNALLRIDPAVVWGTYYGGNHEDEAVNCQTDAAGNVYLVGHSLSASGIATPGSHQSAISGGLDVFLAKFDSAGVRLWATYYGGMNGTLPGVTGATGCALDGAGNLFICGWTNATSGLATPGCFQPSFAGGNNDGYVAKFTGNGTRIWGTYFGGPGHDMGYGCAVDNSDNFYLTGTTYSISGIAWNGFQNAFAGTTDAFLVKFSGAGARIWATYYGGSGQDHGANCATTAAGDVYLCGFTSSTAGIAQDGFKNVLSGPGDAFLARFSSSGARLWGTYFGGPDHDDATSCATDASDHVYLTGVTGSTSGIATANAFQTTYGGFGSDAFLAKFTGAGILNWGTYFGGGSYDGAIDCHTDGSGNVFMAGITSSVSGIASGGFQNTTGGQEEGFVARFSSSGARLWASYAGGAGDDYLHSVTTDIHGNLYLQGITYSSFSGIALNGHQMSYGGGLMDAYLLKVSDYVITTDTIGGTYCAGAPLSVPFTSSGYYTGLNVYTAQLSDAAGSFATPVAIGALPSDAHSGTIAATIPANTPAGTGYRIRVVSSMPVVTGTDNGMNIGIKRIPDQPQPILGDILVCPNSPYAYSSGVVPGAVTYHWTLPAGWTGGSNTPSISLLSGATGGVLTFTASNACGSSLPRTLAVTVGSGTTIPSVSIAAAQPVFCGGTPAVFVATVVNGGNNPVFQWKKNGVNVGTNSSTYSDPAPQNGNTISVEILSNAPCAASGAIASNTITETLTGTTVPGININTDPPHQLCAGTPILFVSNITAGGTNPQYAWYKNGVLLPGETGPTYTDPALQNGDTVQAFLTSSDACPITQPTLSNKRGVTVAPVVTPTLSLSVAPGTTGLTIGTPLTFLAAHTGGGANPSFFWKKNSVTISGPNGAVYTTLFSTAPSAVGPGDQIEVTMASSDPCAVPAIVSSGIVTMEAPLSIGSTSFGWAGSLTLHPNPSSGAFTLEGEWNADNTGKALHIGIYNAIGQRVFYTVARPDKARFSIPVQLSGAVANGLYQLRLSADGAQAVKPLIIQR